MSVDKSRPVAHAPTLSRLEAMGASPRYGAVLKPLQAKRALAHYGALGRADASHFDDALHAAGSDVARAFLWKALAAKHSVAEIRAFGKQISDFYPDELYQTLVLRDAAPSSRGTGYGTSEEWLNTCACVVEMVLHGEADPIYSLATRRANPDIHQIPADGVDPLAVNSELAREQAQLLKAFGGSAAARRGATYTGGIDPFASGLYNSIKDITGVTYAESDMKDLHSKEERGQLLDAVYTQVESGIPTPIDVGVEDFSQGHGLTVVQVRGGSSKQEFLIHDGWTGMTTWRSRADLLSEHHTAGTRYPFIWDYGKATPTP